MPSEPAKQLQQIAQQIAQQIQPQMGAALLFPGHEDGAQLEPFSWDAAAQGEFSSLSLMRAAGFCQEMTLAEMFEAWQNPEQVGAVGGESWLLPERDPAQILLSPETQASHQAVDTELLSLLESRLQNLSGLKFGCDECYAFVLLIGQLGESWIAIGPTVPVATDRRPETSPLSLTPLAAQPESAALPDATAMLQLQIQALLTRRGSAQIYGYYGGGYNQTHEYRLVQATGQTEAEAVQLLMQATGLLRLSQFEAFGPSANAAQFEPLAEMLRVAKAQVYQFSFWDWEQIYLLGEAGEAAPGSRIGVVLRSRFTYNP